MTKISDLSVLSTVDGTETVPVLSGGVNKKVTLSTMLSLSPLVVSSTSPIARLFDTDGVLNAKNTIITYNAAQFKIAAATDAAPTTSAGALMTGFRSGTSWTDLSVICTNSIALNSPSVLFQGNIAIADGVTAPAAVVGLAYLYVDTADGDLKIKFGDGTVKTIVVDT